MKDYKYWVNGYNEVLGEFSIGFKENTDAFNYYCEELKKIKRDGGEIEFLAVDAISYFSNREEK